MGSADSGQRGFTQKEKGGRKVLPTSGSESAPAIRLEVKQKGGELRLSYPLQVGSWGTKTCAQMTVTTRKKKWGCIDGCDYRRGPMGGGRKGPRKECNIKGREQKRLILKRSGTVHRGSKRETSGEKNATRKNGDSSFFITRGGEGLCFMTRGGGKMAKIKTGGGKREQKKGR